MQYSLTPMKGSDTHNRKVRPEREDKKRKPKPFDQSARREQKRSSWSA